MRALTLAPNPAAFAASILRWAGVAVVAGAVLAILGPFGSYMNGGPVRLVTYWISAMLLGSILYGTAYVVVDRWASQSALRWWAGLIAGTLLASVPEALATRGGAFWLWPELARLGLSWPLWFLQTATIGLVSMVGVGAIARRSAPSNERPPPLAPIGVANSSLGGDVLALQMEDHYVRVHRPTGSELIHLPLGRAIECVGPKGLRTHRSWWVASHAVAGVEGNARSMRVLLSNGVVAPVARSAIAQLRAAGWIANAGNLQEHGSMASNTPLGGTRRGSAKL
ncbi:response regulator receiver protein [Novosphingobium sp. Rr 2-17]|uniref:LytTR family DNA-binding domain-containing protein n=1 Tax=Novosphingobium sp. Rr 2-17 TaxID=555793 RepID=UPI0002697AD9|nr:LytTR family DNA-binding domain-containing protein [Novosphingobium sp. Rr 2-17]EIZ81169.1 response regulator receiver protein [Novosphingobium sp. Rr 2-17]